MWIEIIAARELSQKDRYSSDSTDTYSLKYSADSGSLLIHL